MVESHTYLYDLKNISDKSSPKEISDVFIKIKEHFKDDRPGKHDALLILANKLNLDTSHPSPELDGSEQHTELLIEKIRLNIDHRSLADAVVVIICIICLIIGIIFGYALVTGILSG